MLGPKPKENDSTLAHADLGQSYLASQFIFTQQPATQQHVFFRITGNNANIRICSRDESGAVYEVGWKCWRKRGGDWVLVV